MEYRKNTAYANNSRMLIYTEKVIEGMLVFVVGEFTETLRIEIISTHLHEGLAIARLHKELTND